MDDSWPSSAVYRFNGDSLAISLHHSNSEWSMRFSVHLGEELMAFEDKLAGLEVEQERECLLPVLVAAGERSYALFALVHPSSSQLLQPQYLSEERLLVEPFLPWGGFFRERYRWDDDARQQRVASSGHGKGGYASRSGNHKAK